MITIFDRYKILCLKPQLSSYFQYNSIVSLIELLLMLAQPVTWHRMNTYSRFTKKRNDLRIHYRGGGRFWSYF